MDIIKRNNVVVSGKGEKVILFAHGYGCDQKMWRFVAPAFEENYKVILFDHVGSGKSDWNSYSPKKYSTLQGYADDIIEICDSLKLQKTILVAHSVSSMISVLAANPRPDLFEHIIMVGPSPRYMNDGDYYGGFSEQDVMEMVETLDSNYLGWSSAITPIIVGNSDKPQFAEELNNSFCQHDPEIAKHFARVTFMGDNRSDLQKLQIPTLILQCSQDIIVPLEVGKYVHKNIMNSDFVVIETTGHCPHLCNPDETTLAIKKYLTST